MTPTEVTVHLTEALRLEKELADARKRTAKALRAQRKALGLTFRKAAPKVRLSIAALYNTEKGKQWESKTVQKIARYYDAVASERAPQEAA